MVKENAKAISAEADYVEQNGVPGIGVEAALNAAGIVEHENEELLRTLAATDHDAETRDLSDSEIDDALCRGETARAAWPHPPRWRDQSPRMRPTWQSQTAAHWQSSRSAGPAIHRQATAVTRPTP